MFMICFIILSLLGRNCCANKVVATCLTEFSSLTSNITYVTCPAGCFRENGKICGGTVFGKGRICVAAIHDGKLLNTGGVVAIRRTAGASSYTASYSHGVQSFACSAQPYSYSFFQKSQSTFFLTSPAVTTGSTCITNLTSSGFNYCTTPNPCMNGGSCINGFNGYSCACVSRYSGPKCEIDIDSCLSNPCKNKGRCKSGINSFKCICTANFAGKHCGKTFISCTAGVWKRKIVRNAQMTASSHLKSRTVPSNGRFLLKTKKGGVIGAWVSKFSKAGEWLQVDFRTPIKVKGIVTQGRDSSRQYVTRYKIAYRNKTNKFVTIKDPFGADMVFEGPQYASSYKVRQMFPFRITARYFRLIAVAFKVKVAVRLDYMIC